MPTSRIEHSRWLVAIGALTSCSLIAACGSSAKSASPGPGTYRGTTSQGEPLTLTVGQDGKSLAGLEVQAKYTCPAGATAVDGVPRSPTGSVPLNRNSFSGSFTARGTSYQLSGSYRSGTFSGTLSASFPGLTGSGSCTSGSVSWRAARASGNAAPASTTTTTTSPAPASGTPRERLAAAAATYNAGAATFNVRSKADAKAGDLTAFKSDVARFRALLAQFDTKLQQIDFPPNTRSLLNAVLDADHFEVADLDAIASAKTAQTAVGFYNRAVADNQKVIAAEEALYKAI